MYLIKNHLYLRITTMCVFMFCMAVAPINHPIYNEEVFAKVTTIPLPIFTEESNVLLMSVSPNAVVDPVVTPVPTPEPTIQPTPEPSTKPPEFSKQDIALLERVTMSESGNQSFDGKVAVAQTIINRLHTGEYGDSISDIVYSQHQYSTADNGDPNDAVIKAVREAINNPPYPSNMLYFRLSYYHSFGVPYKKIDDHYFSLKE